MPVWRLNSGNSYTCPNWSSALVEVTLTVCDYCTFGKETLGEGKGKNKRHDKEEHLVMFPRSFVNGTIIEMLPKCDWTFKKLCGRHLICFYLFFIVSSFLKLANTLIFTKDIGGRWWWSLLADWLLNFVLLIYCKIFEDNFWGYSFKVHILQQYS